ncbi:MAG: hypothetical protein AB8B55_00875 [Mariniblastus sp.]
MNAIFKRAANRRQHSSQHSQKHAYGALEDRRMLATFIVTTVADSNTDTTDGLISLREAIQAANTNTAFGDAEAGDADGDVIRFATSLNGQTLNLSLGQIEISDDLRIQGGAGNITITGNGNNRFFNVNSTELVGFSKLTFTGGQAAQGGAIASLGTGTTLITESTFTINRASGVGGGAVHNANGNMFLIDSTFTNNSANDTNGRGGAVYAASGLIYSNGSTFTSNTATLSGGAIEVVDGSFYAIDIQLGGTSEARNQAGFSGTSDLGKGGALSISGSATATISGGEISSNTASQNGGAFWVGGSGNLFIRNNASINANESQGSSLGDGGGALYVDGGSAYLNSVTISSNVAIGAEASGGGIIVEGGKAILNNTTVANNETRRMGGGIKITDGFLLLNNSEVIGNDVGTTYTSTTGYGGGLYIAGTASVVINDGQVGNNATITEGGGIWADTSTQTFIRNGGSVSFNSLSGSNTLGGGIYTKGYLQSLDSFFQRNESEAQGGGIFFAGSATGRINNGSFSQNSTGQLGAGIYNNGFMFVTNSVFSSNVAGINGGAFFSSVDATSLQSNLTFNGNLPNNNN